MHKLTIQLRVMASFAIVVLSSVTVSGAGKSIVFSNFVNIVGS